jgi:pimeloyl-ACP methyl ester carboxylesterase
LNPKARRLLLILLVAAAVGWQLLHSRVPARAGAVRAGSSVVVAPDLLKRGQLTLEPCNIGAARSGAAALRAYCTAFEVPEDWATPGGRKIHLKIALVRAESASPDADLVTFLDGGPGGAATEDYPAVSGAFEPLRRRHAVLLVDQRGTGGSNALDCAPGEATAGRSKPGAARKGVAPSPLRGAAREHATMQAGLDQMRACVARLQTRAAPQFYATGDAVRDLEAVRVALGSPLLDLIGVSYGTRMAQQYAQRYPAAVRALVLDGAVPNTLALGAEHARNLEDVLQRVAARCRANAECRRHFGDPYATMQRVQARLRAEPQTLPLRDPWSFTTGERQVDGDDLAELLRFYAYNPLTAALIPYVVAEADAGRYAALLGQTQLVVGDVEDHLNASMALSVLCAEDADRLVAQPADAGTMLGAGLVDWLRAACPEWPHGQRAPGFNEPFATQRPVLVLAGSEDPVTPPRYGAAVVAGLANARLLIAAGQGHAVLTTGCMPRLIQHFIQDLNPQGLDASCLESLGNAPAFLDANGALP